MEKQKLFPPRAHDPPRPAFPERNLLPGRAARRGEIRGSAARAQSLPPRAASAASLSVGIGSQGRGRRKEAKGTTLGSSGNQGGGGQTPGLDLSLDPASC